MKPAFMEISFGQLISIFDYVIKQNGKDNDNGIYGNGNSTSSRFSEEQTNDQWKNTSLATS